MCWWTSLGVRCIPLDLIGEAARDRSSRASMYPSVVCKNAFIKKMSMSYIERLREIYSNVAKYWKHSIGSGSVTKCSIFLGKRFSVPLPSLKFSRKNTLARTRLLTTVYAPLRARFSLLLRRAPKRRLCFIRQEAQAGIDRSSLN